MKIITTIGISLLLLAGAANAQHTNIGIKGGFNGYTLNNNYESEDMKLGYHLGLIGHFHLANPIALQPELVYSMQGSKNTSLNYINLPMLFQYMFDNGFRLQAGPQLGMLVSAKTKTNGTQTDVKNDFEPIDFGVAIGMSYVNPATNFGIDIRYNHGLSDIGRNEGTNAYNRGFQAGVFYLFNHN
jgi:hypothetical protein